MVVIQLSLVVAYLCVLLIKSCDFSSVRAAQQLDASVAKAVCTTFGFGDTATGEIAHDYTKRPSLTRAHRAQEVVRLHVTDLFFMSPGVYLFFVFFGLTMLLLHLCIALSRLYIAGCAPSMGFETKLKHSCVPTNRWEGHRTA